MRIWSVAALALTLVVSGCTKEGKLVTNETGCRTTSTTDTKKKPEVTIPNFAPPATLEKCDLVTGNGDEAVAGKAVTVHYVGVGWTGKKQFDASWDRGDPFPFTLGGGQVIKGWDQGVAGMKVGGRRELIIPPDLAYGPQGAGGVIAPNETLVFVVDLLKVG